MRRTRVLQLAAAVVLCGLGAGCGSSYRAETVLHADGGIDRAIYQPAQDTPDAAREAKLWKEIAFAPKPEELDRKGWPDALTMLPAHARDDSHPYFAAWNHFVSVKDLPEHVLFPSPKGSKLPDGKLERELTQTDLGFVVEYDWRETLTDVVTLTDMHKAREELADGAVQFGREVFAEAIGKEYDVSDLVEWWKTEGKPWLVEATDEVFLFAAAHKQPGEREKNALEDALLAGCERRGLKLTKDGKPLKDEDMKQALQDFAVNLVAAKVKKDGKPVGRETAQKWFEELGSKEGGRFKAAGQKVIDQKYGGDEEFRARLEVLSARIIGLYTLGGTRDFQYTMTFPGPVVETNGELTGDGDKVRWRFRAADAYPLGYSMEARSLLVPEDARKFLGRDKPLSDRDALTNYADTVRGDKGLEDAMRQCRKDKTLDPLYDYLAGQKKTNPAEGVRAERVLKLLKAS